MIAQRPGAIAFLGLGLIGGSIVKAVNASAPARIDQPGARSASRPRITAWSPTGRGPARALAEGLIDAVAAELEDAIVGVDLVIIAAPPIATVRLLERFGGDLRGLLAPPAVVTDVASTKVAVMAAAVNGGIRFVGGHPMAGREIGGFEASSPDLFRDRPWVVVSKPGSDPGDIGPVEWLIGTCGAHPIALDAAAHDAAVAAISHLPLIASAALVEAVAGRGTSTWPLARPLAATGWDGMTRLARGDPAMGAGIASTNAPAIVAELRAYRDAIDGWLASLDVEAPDAAALERRLTAARSLLDEPPSERR